MLGWKFSSTCNELLHFHENSPLPVLSCYIFILFFQTRLSSIKKPGPPYNFLMAKHEARSHPPGHKTRKLPNQHSESLHFTWKFPSQYGESLHFHLSTNKCNPFCLHNITDENVEQTTYMPPKQTNVIDKSTHSKRYWNQL